MINTLLEFFTLIGAGGLIWYIIEGLLFMIIDLLEGMFPTYYGEPHVAFVKSICHWFLFFLIYGGLSALWVKSQRPKQEGWY